MTSRLTGYLFVAAQFTVVAVIVAAPAGDLAWRGFVWTEFFGQLFVLGGLGLVVWAGVALGAALSAHPLPNKRSTLRTSGPFRVARHPIYSGLMTFGIGAALAGASWLHLVSAVILVVVLAAKARYEEAFLIERYGDEYRDYARVVGRFSPWFGRLR